jgi:CHAT domain-containing protein/tetratricopeptide (TPR) repeat protein
VLVGTNSVGERCSQQGDSTRTASIYCGEWEQPSARISKGISASADTLTSLATSSPWRNELNTRFVCNDAVPTGLLGSQPSVLMQCTRRVGGWPHVAVVTLVNGTAWYLDGVTASVPIMARALAIMTGQVSGTLISPQLPGADTLLATRLAAQAMKSGDIGEYEHLMAAGTRANLADSPVAAERAFRAALTLQQKALGVGNPNTADALMLIALQLSNQGQYAQAEPLFARAEQLARLSADPAAVSRLAHYRGLHELNQSNPDRALAYFDQAEAGYTALVPPSLLKQGAATRRTANFGSLADLLPDRGLLVDPVVQSSLLGIIEVRRNRAIALKEDGRDNEAEASLISAAELSRSNNLFQPIVTSRLYRTQGMLDDNRGQRVAALSRLSMSSNSFTRALPGSRSYAITGLLEAGEAARSKGPQAVLPTCRDAVHLLRELHAGTTGDLLMPCLDAYASEAARRPEQAQALLADMFEAGQLAQSSLTSQQIAQASARLLEGARDPRVADAIRKQQEAIRTLTDLYRQRSELTTTSAPSGQPHVDLTELARQITAAEQAQEEADSDLQAASPVYGQLVQQVASAHPVLEALRPHELLTSIVLGTSEGWTFALRDGRIVAGRIAGGRDRVGDLVKRIRSTVEISASGTLTDFDVHAAADLFTALFGNVISALDGASSLVVAPSGPLLSIPFGLLLTGNGDPHELGQAPWLIRRTAIAHVPAPANFVSLRKVAGTSRAKRPWFGFGDFQPIPLALAERSFPSGSCAQSARELAGLEKLPFAGRELEAARQLLGGSPADELTGRAYTAVAVQRMNLANYRILHFASHALLPTDLKCESQPAIVASAPLDAKDASGALLAAGEVSALKLDADIVILSACNSGGPGGSTGGESLSGLARAFFFAGARSMLVTHWSINDQTSAFLVADTLRRLGSRPSLSLEEALRQSQLGLLDGSTAVVAHPFYWAPFALIGEGQTAVGVSSATAERHDGVRDASAGSR